MKTIGNILNFEKKLYFFCIMLMSFYAMPNICNAQEYAFLHYTVDDGLPSSHIYNIMQDRNGYIWFSTDLGISRYDGYRFKNYTTKDGLPYNDVWGLYEDSSGRIWIKAFGPDFYYFQEGEIHRLVNKLDKKFNLIIQDYYEDDQSNIWIITNYKVFLYLHKTQQLKEVKIHQKALKKNKTKTKPISFLNFQDTIRFIQDGELHHLRSLHYRKVSKRNQLYSHQHFHVADTSIYYEDDYLYFSFKDSLVKRYLPLEDCSFLKMKLARLKNEYIFNCQNRVITLDQNFQPSTKYDFLNDWSVLHVLLDAQENLWIATSNEGVYKLPSISRNAKTFKRVGEHYSVESMVKDKEGKIWFCDANNQIYFVEGSKTYPLKLANNETYIKYGTIRDIALSKKNDLLLLYNRGVLRKVDLDQISPAKDGSKALYLMQHELHSSKYEVGHALKSMNESKHTTDLFIATSGGVLCGNLENEESDFQLLTNKRCYTVQAHLKNQFWIGQPNGLFLYENNRMDSLMEIKSSYGVLKKNIKTIAVDSKNRVWLGTDGYGLFVLENGKVDTIQGLEHSIIKKIFIEENDQVLIASSLGLVTVDEQRNVQFFTTAEGLASDEVNCVVSNEDFIYVGTNKGLTVLDRNIATKSSFDFPFYLTKVVIGGKEHKLSKDSLHYFDLTNEENNVKIEYICLSYQGIKNISYEYKMSGIDDTWQSTNRLSKEYPILPYDQTYTFELRAKNINENYSKHHYKLVFKVHPPWWETKIFRFAILMLLVLYIFYRFQKLKKKEEEKTAVNKKISNLKLQALQAQMNPHFVFNALQAIQDFIAGQEERMANKYLSDFSRLMRLFLESSKEKYITLEEEFELISLYVRLEQLRFEPAFDYRLNVPENLDLASIEIPSMLLQPFVENAINHGLKYKKDKRSNFIEIALELEYKYLGIFVIDNGVGRERALEIKNSGIENYKSRSMQIIEERLEAINAENNMNIRIEVKDRMDGVDIDGTIVTILIPINDCVKN